jgi:hypothetical protein
MDSLLSHLLTEIGVGYLHQNARPITHQRVRADCAAVVEILENQKTLLHDLVALLALDVGDEADPAGIVLVRRIVEAKVSVEDSSIGAAAMSSPECVGCEARRPM